jgi:hypothetical protein
MSGTLIKKSEKNNFFQQFPLENSLEKKAENRHLLRRPASTIPAGLLASDSSNLLILSLFPDFFQRF